MSHVFPPMHARVLDTWQMRPVASAHTADTAPVVADASWLPAEVPGHWQQHPTLAHYVGRMLYRCRFTAVPTGRMWLTMQGVFYAARLWLNGQELGQQEGYFAPHHYDVPGLLRAEGDNELLVEVACPEEHDKIGKRLITGVFSHWDSMDATLNPGGIWLPVLLTQSGDVRLHDALLSTVRVSQQQAEIRFQLRYDARTPAQATLRWRFTPHNMAGRVFEWSTPVALAAGAHMTSGVIQLPDPVLWWSHDMGHPALYAVSAEVVLADGTISDTWHDTFGVRTFEMRNWIPYLNGQRMLMKGNNYPPTDVRLAMVTRARCDEDVRLARECHMNVLRVHAHVAHPALYAAADAQGLLLWQDFPLQWMYRREIWASAQEQAREMVFLLGNRASVVIWCMHNESFHIGSTSDERWFARLRTYFSVFVWNWNRDVLDVALQRTVASVDATRPVVRSSGEYAIPLLARGTDAHFYYGWYMIYGVLATWEKIITLFPDNARFVTEFGAQSFPNYDSAVRFMDADIARIDWQHLAKRHSFQPEMLGYWMDWRSAPDLQALIDMTQAYQIRINRHYIDRLRLRKYRPTGGIVPFMFHDANPAVSWSILDYWRVPKRAYAAMQLAFSPQYVFCVCADHATIGAHVELPIMVVNDARHDVELTIEVWLTDPTGAELVRRIQHKRIPADSLALQIDALRLTPQQQGTYCVQMRWGSGVDDMKSQAYHIEVTTDADASGQKECK